MLFFVLVSLAAASGPLVVLDGAQTAACIPNDGYLPSGTDCCKFIVCDAAAFNKTGYEGTCMGGTVWNDDLKVCDDRKYVVPDCDPASCTVPKKTTAECGTIEANQCCVGGRQPVYTQVAGTANEYTVDGFRGSNTCPDDETFMLDDCCCEPPRNTECTPPTWRKNPDSTTEDGSPDPDSCCSFDQCNCDGNGWTSIRCMPPSVWNQAINACDMPNNVMECMTIVCGDDTTDYPCDLTDPFPNCCRNGIWYEAGAGNTYFITGINFLTTWDPDFGRVRCCEPDMMGVEQVFNDAPDVCCCEPAPVDN